MSSPNDASFAGLLRPTSDVIKKNNASLYSNGRFFKAANFNAGSISNKSASICDILKERHLDVLAITESWHLSETDVAVNKITPDGYCSIGKFRPPTKAGLSRRGGGVLFIYRHSFTARKMQFDVTPTTFEFVGINLTIARTNVIFVVIYRPGSEAITELFYSEFLALLELLAVHSCQVVITGDLNIHFDVLDDVHTVKFVDLLESVGFIQHVVGPTHNKGHTLDVVITRNDFSPPFIEVGSSFLSDHLAVFFELPLQRPPLQYIDVQTRAWRGFDADSFRDDLLASDLCRSSDYYDGLTVDQLHNLYDETLEKLLNKHAPRRRQRRRYQPLTPWYDADCAAAKRKARMFERRYRKTELPGDRLSWIDQVRIMHKLFASKQNSFWQSKIKDSSGDPKKLWKTLSRVLGTDRSRMSGLPSDTINAEIFRSGFSDKVERIRQKTASAAYPVFSVNQCQSEFDTFVPVSVNDVMKMIGRAKNKSCSLDPVPSWIIKQFAGQLAPFIAMLFNRSMSEGSFPSRMKHAVVIPALKKCNLDPADVNNYRPISNLSFLSKLLERCVYAQLTSYLDGNDLMPNKQSAYRPFHSTETAVLDVLSDACAAADAGQVTLLGLLDLSAAFDTIDHRILLDRLHYNFGLSNITLAWFQSYLTGRTHAINFKGVSSTNSAVMTGIPQGSVLGPLMFIIYAAEVLEIIQNCGFSVHGYADDLQVYASVDPVHSASLVPRLSSCVERVNDWMAMNRLCLNTSKTEIIWLGSASHIRHCPTEPQLIAGEWITPSMSVRDLGIFIDSDLTSMPTHVRNVINSCYHQIRQLRLIRRSLTFDTAEAMVRAFVHSRLDYCNGVLAGLPEYLYKRLQAVLKSAARLVLLLPSCANVSNIMSRKLHWLGYPHRVTYKLCVLAFKCQHGSAPGYLARHCVPTSSIPARHSLRSASTGMLIVPKTRTKKLPDRGFFHSAPCAWNRLPAVLKTETNFTTFKKKLKTFLFSL